MRNPWLDIPEVDYVGHMSSPTVNQRSVLSRLMGDALQSVRPRTMLALGERFPNPGFARDVMSSRCTESLPAGKAFEVL